MMDLSQQDGLKDVRVWRCRHLARRAGELWDVSLSRNGEPRALLAQIEEGTHDTR